MEGPENKRDDSRHGIEGFPGGNGPFGGSDRGSSRGGLDPDGKPYGPGDRQPTLGPRGNSAGAGIGQLKSVGNKFDRQGLSGPWTTGHAPVIKGKSIGMFANGGDFVGTYPRGNSPHDNAVRSIVDFNLAVGNDVWVWELDGGHTRVEGIRNDAQGLAEKMDTWEVDKDGYRSIQHDDGTLTVQCPSGLVVHIAPTPELEHETPHGGNDSGGGGGSAAPDGADGKPSVDEIRYALIRAMGNPVSSDNSDPRIGLIGNPVGNVAGGAASPRQEQAGAGGQANANVAKVSPINTQGTGMSGGKRPIDPAPDAPGGKWEGTPTISGKIIAARQVIDPIDGGAANKASNQAAGK